MRHTFAVGINDILTHRIAEIQARNGDALAADPRWADHMARLRRDVETAERQFAAYPDHGTEITLAIAKNALARFVDRQIHEAA